MKITARLVRKWSRMILILERSPDATVLVRYWYKYRQDCRELCSVPEAVEFLQRLIVDDCVDTYEPCVRIVTPEQAREIKQELEREAELDRMEYEREVRMEKEQDEREARREENRRVRKANRLQERRRKKGGIT